MKKIPLTQGKFALVDDDDFEELSRFKWHVTHFGYAARGKVKHEVCGQRGLIWMHRVIMNANSWEETDHKSRDKLDNRRRNLRIATHSQNNRNKAKQASNRSGIKGVSWHKEKGKWRATINLNGKHIFLGNFDDKGEAASAYRVAARKYHGEFACV